MKLEEKSTQTETASANGTGNHANTKSVPLLTSLPLGAANDPSNKQHQRRSSHISDLPSPQSVIVKLNNNNPNMAKPTAVNKSAVLVSNLAAAPVLPSADDSSPSKSVVFVDEVQERSVEGQDQRAKSVAASANSNSAAISNGPAVPLNVSDSTIRDVAL